MKEVTAAAAALEGGGVVVCPTETVYGLCARPDRPGALDRVFELKGRPRDQVLQVLVGDVRSVEALAIVDRRARGVMGRFMPGPLTLVLGAGPSAPPALVRDGTIGVRAPDHALARELLALTGPLAATSANRSGEPTPAEVGAIREVFGDAVDVYLDGGRIEGTGSTVVDLTGDQAVVLREGAIPGAELLASL